MQTAEAPETAVQELTPDELRLYAANVRKYSIYAVFNGLGYGLFIAIWIIYLQQGRGLSLTEVAIMEAFFWVVMAASEVPTGAVADNQGRKVSLLWGMALISVSMFLWGLASTLPLLLITYLVMGIGFTFLSGAQDAFLFESLHIIGRVKEYTRVSGQVSAIGSAVSGVLASVDLALPIFISALMFLLALGVALF